MPHYLDVASWARRDTFEFFRHFDKPYFNGERLEEMFRSPEEHIS